MFGNFAKIGRAVGMTSTIPNCTRFLIVSSSAILFVFKSRLSAILFVLRNGCTINEIIIYMKKLFRFDWLRAVQFLGNTVPKKEILKFNAKKGNSVQISLDFKFLNYLTIYVYL